jgi:cold shock CspA family protein
MHNWMPVEIGSEGAVIVSQNLGRPNKLTLEVRLPDGLIAFRVNRNKDVRLLAPWEVDDLVEVLLNTGFTSAKLWVTFYPGNGFRLLDLRGSELRIWEISLVRQDNRFYLVSQCVYTVDIFRSEGGKVVCPTFEREDHGWPQLVELVNACFAEKMDLPALPTDYKMPVVEAPVITDKNTGWVQWYNFANGVGVIHTSNGPARVHWSSIIQPESGGFVGLEAGQMVKFTTVGPNEPCKQPSTIQYQVYGVSPISS